MARGRGRRTGFLPLHEQDLVIRAERKKKLQKERKKTEKPREGTRDGKIDTHHPNDKRAKTHPFLFLCVQSG